MLGRRAEALTWTCPVCDRRVPRREPECFCGARRERVEQDLVKKAAQSPRRIPRDVVALLALIVLVGAYGIHRLVRSEREDTFAQAAQRTLGGAFVRPDPSPREPPPAPRPSAVPTGMVESRAVLRLQPVDEAPSPALPMLEKGAGPQATPSPSEREEKRLAGIAGYEIELTRLTPLADRLAEHVKVFKTDCLGGQRMRFALTNCEEIEATIKRSASNIEQALDGAEDAARRAWVEPGAVREVRARSYFGTSDWEGLLRSAHDPRRP